MLINAVAPFAGAWIEITNPLSVVASSCSSLPSRERGLKFGIFSKVGDLTCVAPFAGAWIEIVCYYWVRVWCSGVAPFAGAWIEIL